MTDERSRTATTSLLASSYASYLHSRRFRRLEAQTTFIAQGVAQFLDLSAQRRFEELVRLRISAAHLSGGSFGAFTGAYLAVILGVAALLTSGPFGLSESLLISVFGVVTLVGGLLVAIQLAREQRKLALDAVLLQFCEELHFAEAQ
jgi:general stress protein CsbA